MQGGQRKTSKYIKPAREEKAFYWVSVAFLFSLFVMPQYFGLPTPVFDFTLLRMMIVALVFMIIYDDKRKSAFADLILHSKLTLVLIPYLIVISYTMVLRADINAFLNPFIEIFSLYLLIYVIRDYVGVERTLKWLLIFIYILAIQGIIEYAIGRSLFSYLETIKGLYTGQFIRSGNYRIMGPCVHSLGYGLLLIAVTPIACLDYQKNEIDLLRRPFLFLLLAANVFLTGSRSTLSVFIIEAALIFLLSSKEKKKKCVLLLSVSVVALGGFLVVGYNTGLAQYILLQFASIIDSVFGTEYSLLFGGNLEALGSSSNYRDQLIYIFTVDWLNPFLGLGRKRTFSSEVNGSYIKSVDNFYIAEYVRYAYPGLVTYAFFLLFYLFNMIKKCMKRKDAVYKILLIGSICYLINLLWVDSLQTLKYLYILIAILLCLERKDKSSEVTPKKASKYIKKASSRWM
ncbi:MAG: hypothetical protein IJO85_00910 [Lachnospiraceae bacterium]|nr:hypothetical protein [Lachnospiraceae bacterium]